MFYEPLEWFSDHCHLECLEHIVLILSTWWDILNQRYKQGDTGFLILKKFDRYPNYT